MKHFQKQKSDKIAQDLLGMEFETGGREPKKIDCYGVLVHYFKEFEISIPDYSNIKDWGDRGEDYLKEYSECFRKLSRDEKLEIGDVILFNSKESLSHAGVYLGKNEFVHSYSKIGTKIDSLINPIWKEKVYSFFRIQGEKRDLVRIHEIEQLGSGPIIVTYIPCLFENKRYEFKTHNASIATVLLSLVRTYPEIREDSPNMSIRVNGVLISPFAWSRTELKDGDRVFVIQEIGITAVLTAIFGSAIYIGAGLVVPTYLVATLITVALTIASTIYNLCNKPDAPRARGADTPTYGWDGVRTSMSQGGPVPIVYGEHTISGHKTGGKKL
jgi:hypothetical protein